NGGRDRKQRERGRSYSESQDQAADDSPEKRLSTLLIILGDKMTPQEIHKNIEKIAEIVQTEYSKYEPLVAFQLRERSPEMLDSILSKIERYFESRERAIAEIGGSVVLQSIMPYIGSNLPYDQADVTDISYFLIRDIIDDIIEIYEINRKECTKYLKDLAYNFASGTFVEKDTTTSITKSETKVKDEPDIKIEPDMDTFPNNWGVDDSKEANASSISNQGIVGFKLEQIIVEEFYLIALALWMLNAATDFGIGLLIILVTLDLCGTGKIGRNSILLMCYNHLN
ncbi:13363_t:CDS:2, partial [Racocetra fulgida]